MKCLCPKTIWPHRSIEWCDLNEEYPISVPCGKCLICLSHKRSEWAFRLEQEYKYSKGAYFVTLTYDQKHCPFDGSLNKKHVQDYLKRLRKKDGSNTIRYYLVGEYGSNTARPHYHLLLFNCRSEEFIRSAWSDSKGFPIGIVHIGSVTGASVAYVLKYLVQPSTDLGDREKPFSLMSRRYGLGGRYLDDAMVDWHRRNDSAYCIREGVKIRMPRFYKSKIWYNEIDKIRISKAGLEQSLVSAESEINYYKKIHGANWETVRNSAIMAVVNRIKSKVKFTQTF